MDRPDNYPVWYYDDELFDKTNDWYDADKYVYINYFLYTNKKLDLPELKITRSFNTGAFFVI